MDQVIIIVGGNAYRIAKTADGTVFGMESGPVYVNGQVSEDECEWCCMDPHDGEEWTDAKEAIYTALQQLNAVRM